MEKLFNYYENYSEDTRLLKDNTHKIEFITTVHVLDGFICPNSKILDVGAGTGRYSFYFREKGHSVYALEYVPHNLRIIEDKLKAMKFTCNIEAAIGDGRDLSRFADDSFDVVLCMGPLYHLKTEEDKKTCINECLRVLKKGGILAVAYINKYASFIYKFKTDKDFMRDTASKNLINNGSFYGDERDDFYFTSPQEIVSLLTSDKVEILTNVATDGIGYMLKDNIEDLNDEEYQLWLNYHLNTCHEPSLLGYSLHALVVSRKK